VRNFGEAQQVLIASSPQLVLTDLSLPDGSGLDLLHWLHDRAQQSSGLCRTVVFSGGIDPTMERKLKALQVWRVLHKPASVGSLMACVADALAAEVQAVESAAAVPQSDPVAEFFGGNRPLYDAYRAASVVQLVRDLDDGDRAVRAGDLQALRRVPTTSSQRRDAGARQAVQVAVSRMPPPCGRNGQANGSN
jgi:DNA-binding NarL/FixJ family response regulator